MTNQFVTFLLLKVFWKLWPFDHLIRVDYRSEVTRTINNRMTLIILKKNTALCLKYDIWLVEITRRKYKVHLNMISYGELSEPLYKSQKIEVWLQSDWISCKIHFTSHIANFYLCCGTLTKCKMAATTFHRASACAKENPMTFSAFITER